ncbi:hypothetical protein ACI65C_004298 [Semiaphis heraclei]
MKFVKSLISNCSGPISVVIDKTCLVKSELMSNHQYNRYTSKIASSRRSITYYSTTLQFRVSCRVDIVDSTIKKQKILKSPYYVQVYKEILPDIPLPPEPVLTRWGTWLEAAIFNCNNFQGLKKVIEELSSQKSPSQSILKCKSVFDIETIQNDLIFIKAHFLVLVTSIKSLEKSNVSLVDSINLIENTIGQLQKIPGENGNKIKIKIDQLQQKNQGLIILKNVAKVLNGNNKFKRIY